MVWRVASCKGQPAIRIRCEWTSRLALKVSLEATWLR